MSLYHSYFELLCGIVDVLLNGVPSDDPFLLTFYISERFVSHFIVLFLNKRDVSNEWRQQYNFASRVIFAEEMFA